MKLHWWDIFLPTQCCYYLCWGKHLLLWVLILEYFFAIDRAHMSALSTLEALLPLALFWFGWLLKMNQDYYKQKKRLLAPSEWNLWKSIYLRKDKSTRNSYQGRCNIKWKRRRKRLFLDSCLKSWPPTPAMILSYPRWLLSSLKKTERVFWPPPSWGN